MVTKELAHILEHEDLESLKYLKKNIILEIDTEIVAYILEMGEFSAESLLNISMEHALRYIQLCNQQKQKEISQELDNYIIVLTNSRDNEERH